MNRLFTYYVCIFFTLLTTVVQSQTQIEIINADDMIPTGEQLARQLFLQVKNILKIALNLKAEEIIELLALAGFHIGKHELSAFFRRADHKHYRECKDQILRNFLKGVQLKVRED